MGLPLAHIALQAENGLFVSEVPTNGQFITFTQVNFHIPTI